jgi:hypothetical protein
LAAGILKPWPVARYRHHYGTGGATVGQLLSSTVVALFLRVAGGRTVGVAARPYGTIAAAILVIRVSADALSGATLVAS